MTISTALVFWRQELCFHNLTPIKILFNKNIKFAKIPLLRKLILVEQKPLQLKRIYLNDCLQPQPIIKFILPIFSILKTVFSSSLSQGNKLVCSYVPFINVFQSKIDPTTLIITSFSITTFSITELFMTLRINDTQHGNTLRRVPLCLGSCFIYCNAHSDYPECCYAERRNVEHHGTQKSPVSSL